MRRKHGTVIFLATLLVVFPVLDGMAASVPSEGLDTFPVWFHGVLTVFFVPILVLAFVLLFRREYG